MYNLTSLTEYSSIMLKVMSCHLDGTLNRCLVHVAYAQSNTDFYNPDLLVPLKRNVQSWHAK